MGYYIWDNDNAILVCATYDRKKAFAAVLTHLIEAHGSEIPDPIMYAMIENQKDALTLIHQAEEAFEKIADHVQKL